MADQYETQLTANTESLLTMNLRHQACQDQTGALFWSLAVARGLFNLAYDWAKAS